MNIYATLNAYPADTDGEWTGETDTMRIYQEYGIILEFSDGHAYMVSAKDLRAAIRMFEPEAEEPPSPPRAIWHTPDNSGALDGLPRFSWEKKPSCEPVGPEPAAVSEWYAVEDRLPPDTYVMIRIETRQTAEGWAIVKAKRDKHGCWFRPSDEYTASRITHWAAFPSFDDKEVGDERERSI